MTCQLVIAFDFAARLSESSNVQTPNSGSHATLQATNFGAVLALTMQPNENESGDKSPHSGTLNRESTT